MRRHTLTTPQQIQDELDDPGFYGIILMQAGRASLAVAQAGEIICSKQVQKYMVRKTQGKAQYSYLNQKGKSRLGSRIRLRQTDEFFQEINERWLGWNQVYDLEQLFLSCTPKLKGAWFQSSSNLAFEKSDPRWRRVPFMVHLPNQAELFRIHWLLCRAMHQ